MKKKKLSIVIPVYNEEQVLPRLTERLSPALERISLSADSEVIFVNDGSSDGVGPWLKARMKENPGWIVVNLSRNFGHTEAVSAGLSITSGDAVIVMDADLQDPPELIPEMWELYTKGNQVVIAERRSRQEKGFRRWAFDWFYTLFGFLADFPMTGKTGVFGLMDRMVVNQINQLPEHNRFLPGLRNWVGFRRATVFYDRDERVAGKPKQTLKRLMRYGLNAVFSFSYKPLRVILIAGVMISLIFFIYAVVLVMMRVLQLNVVRGFTTPTVTMMFLGGVQLVAIGILGEYLARIYDEVKRRPLFIISEIWRSKAEEPEKAK